MLNLSRPIILASQSPRRKSLLRQIGLDFILQPSDIIEENMSLDLSPIDYSIGLARQKAEDVAGKQKEPSIIIAADTIVVIDGCIINKPRDANHACEMLRKLSSRTHTVYTGLAIALSPENTVVCAARATNVTFRSLEEDEIKDYVATGSPLDKAGAYGIQDDFGAVFVERIEGCYYNIVGLPLELLYRMLRELPI